MGSTAVPGEIKIVTTDMTRLRRLVEGQRLAGREDPVVLDRLEEELERAVVLAVHEVPSDLVTLDSEARLVDLSDGRALQLSPVLPYRADAARGRISVLAPLGMAILGYRAGDSFEWEVPSGLRRMKVEEVIYQPEAAALRRSRRGGQPRAGSRARSAA